MNAKLPANTTCTTSSSIAGTHVTSSRNDTSIAELAADVLDARQRLRQVDLQRVGAPVVGDQPGAGVDRDEEDEDVLLARGSRGTSRASARGTTPAGSSPRRRSARRARRTASSEASSRPRNARLAQHRADAGRAMTGHARPCAPPVPPRSAGSSGRESARPSRSPRPPARTRLRASARSAGGGAPATPLGRRDREQLAARRRSPGTNTRMTSSSVSWHSRPAACSRSTKRERRRP